MGHRVSASQLPIQVAAWPAYWRELYEERAGIMEYLGNMERKAAEFTAERAVRRQYQQEQS